jgi:hypothetical protein
MGERADIIDFIHPVLNTEIRTISGQYVLTRERRLAFNDQRVLYYVGCATVDSSCCGVGGTSYALVPGYIREWKYKKSRGDLSISRVEPIRDTGIQSEIRQLILRNEAVQQVNFE